MASLNAPKKAKVSVTTVAQKKQTITKSSKNSCASPCNGRTSAPSAPSAQRKSHLANSLAAKEKTSTKSTRIIVKCNCGFPNSLYIRGEGVKGLSWEKGTIMKCTKADEWVWESQAPFTHAQIKVLINDKEFELGENHSITCGKSITFSPKFSR